ncbi:MAG: hypothetical protein GC181_08440 [Bacteroidetes bacterium]|nr:hypothetical protein [Bacteroidota bacterium]
MIKVSAVLTALAFLVLINGCKPDEPVGNQAPDTFISVERIDRSGENRLNTSVYLSWYGTDQDGFITGYEYSTNQVDWYPTQRRDSTFKFSIDPGQDTADIEFYVRSIDDKAEKDPTPAYLKVPLRNSPPEVSFDSKSFPADTAFCVVTFRWNFSDPDGDNTVAKAELKLNNGNWIEIDRSKIMISLRAKDPTKTGSTQADLFYNTDKNSALSVDGFVSGGSNTIYLRVQDQAGTVSEIDTSNVVFVRNQTSDLLLISGQPPNVNSVYKNLVSKTYGKIDAVDFAESQGAYQPKFWNPTFTLLTGLYDKLVFNCDQSLFSNPMTGQSGLLLEFASEVLQNYTDGGGKSFIITSFPAGFTPENIRGALPVDSLSTTSGQAVINKDSAVYSSVSGWPVLRPSNLILGVDPFVPTADAEPLYRATLTKYGAWSGPDVVAARRRTAGKTKQVFFSVEVYLLNKDQSVVEAVFDKVLNQEFNW